MNYFKKYSSAIYDRDGIFADYCVEFDPLDFALLRDRAWERGS